MTRERPAAKLDQEAKLDQVAELDEVVEDADASLLEIIDHVLNKGVVVHGEVILGVADVDLVYLRLSALVCAADRVKPR